MTERRVKQSGFSVIEVTIAVAIMMLLVAIVVPRMFSAKVRANEASAEASIHVINVAEALYNNTYPQAGYANSLAVLGSHGGNCETVNSSNACLVDSTLSTGIKAGYLFEILGDGNTPDVAYSVTASPEAAGGTGSCAFSSNQTGVIQITTAPVGAAGSRSSGLSGDVCGSASR
ncbi:MAG TPA: type II secretion system protein [Candidatus Saccharimonadales bacterium]|jgi:type II secretory pathway pseudopilin PulG|nr:type II secretion system protein [Candidatus Saccharimonadales bacterium]